VSTGSRHWQQVVGHSTDEGSTLAAAQATEDSARAMDFLDIIMLSIGGRFSLV